ncbi:MAG: hypothetical protein GY769_02855 [bacterium]|nr:hypothetical protein [bacterium]
MSHRNSARPVVAFGLALISAGWLACSSPADRSPPADAVGAPEFLAGEDPANWVKIYDPARAWNGYTLALYGRRIPMLLDMNGKVLHSWTEARVKSRVRLLPDCSLLGLALGRAIVEYDWNGELVWEVPIENAIPHHDLIRRANGNTMVLILRGGERTDDILEINRAGDTVWEWKSGEHLDAYYALETASAEITHLNSIQELPPNKWFDGGDSRFRPGNLLISARNMNAIFLIDRATKEVVWTYSHELDRQHEALMIAKGFPRAGNIVLFDNGYASTHVYRQSRILEIDPSDKAVVWSYDAEGFYSPTGGIEQPLPNGNVLISSTRGRRAFEINRAGRTVWEWAPPFEPNRPSRIAYDHCPELVARAKPDPRPVRPRADYRHVDPRTYVYARKGAIAEVRIDGAERRALREKNSCRKVLVPAEAEVLLGYGINRRGARGAGHANYSARFRLTLSGTDPPTEEVLVDETLDMTRSNWEERAVGLDEQAFRWVDLCLSIERVGATTEAEPTKFAFWTNPVILPRGQQQGSAPADQPTLLTPEEAEVQRQHLKALGYVD